ncbi:hypothetical protein Pint_15816 [Pistacia integerrima]|uniref:Uncharacterized protein n=1 Tax=Pistacia integerrima TaxID=434235 RepID=A0ACC0ZEJ0_9ROSI|nr:hypothetical protein Pint_15816 [Pistacia integerrima]
MHQQRRSSNSFLSSSSWCLLVLYNVSRPTGKASREGVCRILPLVGV